MIDWAHDMAAALLAEPLPQRWQHSLGVQRQAAALGVAGEDGAVLEAAAVLHDIGYSPAVAVTGFHPLDGATYLRSVGVDERIVRLVAHHSCALIEAEMRGVAAQMAAFSPQLVGQDLVDGLIWADMTTSPDGKVTTVGERLEEVIARYGRDSVVGRFVGQARPCLAAACCRVEAASQAVSGRLSVAVGHVRP